mmetsp:Transcript_19783/g.41124  ORF Transcript_19783/g.41124 Transcript_19783/m.41124 type:complete len:300 (-) Transcript_19783:127-1026(-)
MVQLLLSSCRPYQLGLRRLFSSTSKPPIIPNEAALTSFLSLIDSPTSSSSLSPSGAPSGAPPEHNLDHSRTSRTGFPEVVFGATKTPSQIASIMSSLRSKSPSSPVLCTLVPDRDAFDKIDMAFSGGGWGGGNSIDAGGEELVYHEEARMVTLGEPSPTKENLKTVLIITAGTTDIPVASEALVTLQHSSIPTSVLHDCGVAGLHRIVRNLPLLASDSLGAVVVCAGMDGALPSVVAGLTKAPVIAVPTSVGYGASFGGVAAMLTMMNSCAPGVSVVNIDAGFSAAAAAFKIVSCNAAG